jgi:ABC-type sugar transport system ATPase subunit
MADGADVNGNGVTTDATVNAPGVKARIAGVSYDPNAEPYVVMRGISKSFYGVEVLHGVDFSVRPGEVAALCGENGAGKSTLMKILAAVYSLEQGEIKIGGAEIGKGKTPLEMQMMGVSMVHQELNLVPNMTVAQNIFLSREPVSRSGLVDVKKMNDGAARLIDSLGESIDPNEKVSSLKVAQQQMVEIAKAVSFDVRILVMDEPTSMLTNKETDILFALTRDLAAKGISVIYISHRLKEIKQFCDTVTILRDGCLAAKKDVADVTEQEIANLMVGREVSSSEVGDFTGDENDVVLEVSGLSDATILRDVSFKVRRGEILGFAGLVGAGRSELMEHIFGLRRRTSGEIKVYGKAAYYRNPVPAIKNDIGFATEDRKDTGLVGNRTVTENINYVKAVKTGGFLINAGEMRANLADMKVRLNIKVNDGNMFVNSLSGGNQQKIVLGKWLLVNSDILLLDEPTRGIDVGAREEIYRIIGSLASEGKTILIVSSDMTEILSICQRIIVMHEGRVITEYTGADRNEEKIMQSAANV